MDIRSPTPRRVSRPRWLDPRLVAGIVLVIAAVLIGATVIQHSHRTEKRLAATRDLAAGATLTAGDLASVDVQLPHSVKGAHVYVSDPERAVGRVLAEAVAKGELVPAAALGTAPGRTTVSVPFAPDAAPPLRRGQRIVVWLSTAACPSLVLLPDVTVQDVHAADAGTFASSGVGQDVVLSVTPELAQRLVAALAIDRAVIRAGVLSGPAHAASAPPPALDSCGAAPSP